MLYQTHNSIGQYYFECIRYYDFHYSPHMHRHHELIHVKSGELILTMNGRDETISQGEYGWIPSNYIHSYRTPTSSVVDVCIFSEDHVPLFAKEIREKKADKVKFTCRDSVMRFADQELFVTEKLPDLYTLKAALYAVLGELLSQVTFTNATAKNEILMDRIVRYVADNYTDNITLKSAAKELGYEEHYLSRCFHNTVPMHFSKYVNLFRVDAATTLLQHTDLSISDIAMQSGFQSIRSFNRVFLEVTGKTPSSFFT